MTLQVSFVRAARAELVDATAWYASRNPLLGAEFVAEVERCLSLALAHHQRYAVVYRGLRLITTKRFPYGIYFRVTEQKVIVIAVFHSSRDPAIWQDRV